MPLNAAVTGLFSCQVTVMLVPQKDEHKGKDVGTLKSTALRVSHMLTKVGPGRVPRRL